MDLWGEKGRTKGYCGSLTPVIKVPFRICSFDLAALLAALPVLSHGQRSTADPAVIVGVLAV